MKRFLLMALVLSTQITLCMQNEKIIRGLIFLRLLPDNNEALNNLPRPGQQELKKMWLARHAESQQIQKQKMQSKHIKKSLEKRKLSRQRESYNKGLSNKR